MPKTSLSSCLIVPICCKSYVRSKAGFVIDEVKSYKRQFAVADSAPYIAEPLSLSLHAKPQFTSRAWGTFTANKPA